MADVFISKYQFLARDADGNVIAAGQEPALAEQKVAIGAETDSAAFNANTYFVRIHAEAACCIVFGSAPTADVNTKRMPAGAVEFFGVRPGHKVSVILDA